LGPEIVVPTWHPQDMKAGGHMGKTTLVRSHVERCLQDIWDVCRVETDHDGDHPFSRGTSMCFVRVERGKPIAIRVFGYAVIDIERSGKLLKELNDINGRCRFVAVRWQGNAVIVEQVISLDGLTRGSLREACNSVSFVADDIGPMIATVFGGSLPNETDDASTHPHREAS
jgi:hypothetical protein